MTEEAVDAGTARDVEKPTEGARAAPSNLRSALGVLVLAAGFALVPRVTKGCEAASLDEDAPDWEAKVVANASALPGADPGAASNGPVVAPTHLKLENLRGHPVILDFWATWCGPCQMEAPVVNTIAQRYKDRGLAVIGVNTSDEDGLAAQFIRQKHLGFPVVYDEGNRIAKKYGVTNLPTLIVVSKTGKVVAIRTGVTSDSALDDIVRRYL
ncbi:MAG: TlpA disulfide reductase family protein [Labilithrix sp.]